MSETEGVGGTYVSKTNGWLSVRRTSGRVARRTLYTFQELETRNAPPELPLLAVYIETMSPRSVWNVCIRMSAAAYVGSRDDEGAYHRLVCEGRGNDFLSREVLLDVPDVRFTNLRQYISYHQ